MSLWMKSESVTIQMKSVDWDFPVILFITYPLICCVPSSLVSTEGSTKKTVRCQYISHFKQTSFRKWKLKKKPLQKSEAL